MKSKSLRGAINQMCRQCLYDPHAGGAWKEQIMCCSDKTCPLWHVRTTTGDAKLKEVHKTATLNAKNSAQILNEYLRLKSTKARVF